MPAPGQPRPRPRRKRWLVVGFAVLGALALAGGVVIGSEVAEHASEPSGPAALASDFARLESTLHAKAGIAVGAVGEEQDPTVWGDLRSGPAWSTVKVPLILAAYRAGRPPGVTDEMTAAITESDNAAAESIWSSLGDPATAAHEVDAVLRGAGDPTSVESRRVRPEFSAFGQTEWPLTDQVRFLSDAWCDTANAPIFALMGRVEADQSWGIGTLGGSRFKGGWGPSPTGRYLVRQMGVLVVPHGLVAVALAAEPDSGSFEDGVADLTEMAGWLHSHIAKLPAGRCSS